MVILDSITPVLDLILPGTEIHTGHQSNTARSTALRSFSQLITEGALERAVSGSLRPWPVRTQTTVSGLGAPSTVGRPWARRPATEAALAGSQKTPSLSASQR